MKRVRVPLFALAVAAVAACSSAGTATTARTAEPPTPAPLDPVGEYSFSTTFQGVAVEGRIVIRGAPGSYTGMVEPAEGPPPVEIYSVSVEDRTVTVYGDAGGSDLIITMTFTGGNSYTGTWILGFDSGELAGARIQQ